MPGTLGPKCSMTIKRLMLTCWFTQRVTRTAGRHEGVSARLTFTVGRVGVELEAGLAQAQERAVGVEALAPDAHVVFAAFVHI